MLPCVVETGEAGYELSGQIHFWLDDYGLRELVVHVEGQVVANGSN